MPFYDAAGNVIDGSYQMPPPEQGSTESAVVPAPATGLQSTEQGPPASNVPSAVPVHETPTAATGTGGGGLRAPDPTQEISQLQTASNDIQAAHAEVGAADAAAAEQERVARAHAEERMALEQEKIAATQRLRESDVQRINQHQQEVYDEAHRATVPDFWEGRPGAQAGAAIAMALGEAGRGLTAFATGANVGNTAKEVIDNSIREYTSNKKFEIDNLFKYAEATNKLGEEQKATWAQKLNDLQFEMAALHQSAADHILEVAAASKGRIDQAQAKVLATTQQQQAVQLENVARQRSYENQIQKRHLGIEGFNAQSERIKAIEMRAQASEQKQVQYVDKRMDEYHRELAGTGLQAGPLVKLDRVNQTIASLDEAWKTGNADKIAGAISSATEQLGPALAGGKTTAVLKKTAEDMRTLSDEIQKVKGKLGGGNTVGQHYFQRFRNMLINAGTESAQLTGNVRQRAMTEMVGPGGTAATPAMKERFMNRLKGLTSEAAFLGKPLFEEGGAAPATQAPAPAATPSYPVGTRATSGGKPIQWNGNAWTPVQ